MKPAQDLVQKPVMDLVVPIHGQIEMNRIFFDYLTRNTRNPFRLIVVDNASPDESADFFESRNSRETPVVVIRNPHNQCYPVSINQGVQAGSAPVVGLLNNDILAGPGWDEPLLKAILEQGYPVVSPGGLEHFPDRTLEEIFFQRWRYINKRRWSQDPKTNIQEKIHRMYGDFDNIAERIQKKYESVLYPGIMGHCHLLKRETFEGLGGLDPRIQSADWDLFLTIEKMGRTGAFEKSPIILGGSFVHHFIRLTDSHVKRTSPVCTHLPHLRLEEKWKKKEIRDLWPFKDQIPDSQILINSIFKKKIIKILTRLVLWKKDINSLIMYFNI
jgi:glycosyltransferase involved in cell wall biosynthesis